MTDSQRLLLLLLQRSLTWQIRQNEPDPLPEKEGQSLVSLWPRIIKQADEQEVFGLAFDALESLPKEQQPEGEMLMHYAALVCSNERDFELYKKRCLEIWRLLSDKIDDIALMKGLLLARHYPIDSHREIGDMDLFINHNEINKAIDILERAGATIDRQPDNKHVACSYLDINLELHFKSIYFYNRRTEKKYRLFEAEETSREELCLEALDAGNHVLSFPPIFEMVYLTAHIQHHLLLEEIKLRHIVDWILALQHNRTALAISEIQLQRQLSRFGLTRLFRSLGYISIKYLGFEADSFAGISHLTDNDAIYGEYLLQIILNRHIPGCKPYEPRTAQESFTKKARLYGELLKRCWHLRKLIPREAWATPIGFLRHAYKRRHNRL